MPIGGAGYLCGEADICQGMIEVTRLPVKRIGVRKGAMILSDEVDEVIACSNGIIGTSLDLINGVFLGVRVQVTHDQEVRVATTCRIGGKPVDQGLCCSSTSLAAIALSITEIRVANIGTGGTLGFEVVNGYRETGASRNYFKCLGKDWTTPGIDKAWVHRGCQNFESTHWCNHSRFIDQPHTDGICADHAGINVGIRSRSKYRVETCHDPIGGVAQRIHTGRVLNLVKTNNIAIQTCKSLQKLIALPCKFLRFDKVSAAAFHVLCWTAFVIQRVACRIILRDEEVERVHCRHTQAATYWFWGNRARVVCCVVGRPGRYESIETEVEAQNTDRILHMVTATEEVAQREWQSVRVTQHGWVRSTLRIIQYDAAQAVGKSAGIRRGSGLVNSCT